jgi:hypothetical protein
LSIDRFLHLRIKTDETRNQSSSPRTDTWRQVGKRRTRIMF